MAQNHKVTLALEEDVESFATVRSGNKLYSIDKEQGCSCPDYQKVGSACKHILALLITQTAPTFFDHEQAVVAVEVLKDETAIVASHVVENPAGCNFKAKIGNAELWYTWHDVSDAALLGRLNEVLPQLQAMMAAAEERQAAREQARQQAVKPPDAPISTPDLSTLIAKAVQEALKSAALPPSSNNGTKPAYAPPDSNDTDRSWCPHHNIEMDFHPENDRGPAWYSHRLGSGGYCKGGN